MTEAECELGCTSEEEESQGIEEEGTAGAASLHDEEGNGTDGASLMILREKYDHF